MKDDFGAPRWFNGRVAQSAPDYRSSHLAKGANYDRDLGAVPFDAYMAERERELLRRIVPRLFGGRRAPRYLDFACGTGRITATVAPMADASYGIDIAESMLAEARRKCPATEFHVVDVTREPPPIEPVDLATAFRFVGNAQDELRRAALGVLSRLVRPGGYVILNNHRNHRSIHNMLMRLRGEDDGSDLTHAALTRLLAEAGFRIVVTYGIGAWVIRHTLRRDRVLRSRLARILESLSRLPRIAPVCPDFVVVARRAP